MVKHIRIITAVVGAAVALGASQAKADNIVEVAAGAGTFQTLLAAAEAAGLVETLAQGGPFTVFAPNDDAFKKLPKGTVESLLKPENKDKLVAVLTYHVVPGVYMAEQVVKLPRGTQVETVNGASVTVRVTGKNVMINTVRVIATDIKASNGVIHVIDRVLLPPSKPASPKDSKPMGGKY